MCDTRKQRQSARSRFRHRSQAETVTYSAAEHHAVAVLRYSVIAPDQHGPEVVVPADASGLGVRLHGYEHPDDDALAVFQVDAVDSGLSASIVVQTIAGDDLAGFVQSLEEDFRGWDGERVWVSMWGDLELRATHLGRFIRLSWTLRFPTPAEQTPDWSVTVHVLITPGEELKRFASDTVRFLNEPS